MHKNDKYFNDIAYWDEDSKYVRRPLGIVKDELGVLELDYVENPTKDKWDRILYIQEELNNYGFK